MGLLYLKSLTRAFVCHRTVSAHCSPVISYSGGLCETEQPCRKAHSVQPDNTGSADRKHMENSSKSVTRDVNGRRERTRHRRGSVREVEASQNTPQGLSLVKTL